MVAATAALNRTPHLMADRFHGRLAWVLPTECYEPRSPVHRAAPTSPATDRSTRATERGQGDNSRGHAKGVLNDHDPRLPEHLRRCKQRRSPE